MRKHRVVFLVGPPASGKTSVLRRFAMPPDEVINDTEVRWTLKPPFAFVGTYLGLALDGGDQVARHANILAMEYWARNIFPDPRIHTTFIDGEMFLWARIQEGLKQSPPRFVDEDNDRDHNYREGGLRRECWQLIVQGDESRFPALSPEDAVESEVHLSCVYLNLSDEASLARRKAREAASGEGESKNSDRHMKIAASKQRNFAAKFKPEDVPFFMDSDPDAPPYLELDIEDMTSEQIEAEIRAWLEETAP